MPLDNTDSKDQCKDCGERGSPICSEVESFSKRWGDDGLILSVWDVKCEVWYSCHQLKMHLEKASGETATMPPLPVLTPNTHRHQINIPHTITPPPPAWTIDTRQDGSMLSCCLRQILTLPSECHSRNRDSSDQATFFQSSIVQFWWARANCSLSFLFVADRRGTRCGLLLL